MEPGNEPPALPARISTEPPPSTNRLRVTQVPRAKFRQPHSSHKRNLQKVQAAFTTPQK